MEILQALLDRHKNQTILSVVTVKSYPGITLIPPNRSDIIFANKQVGNLMAALIKSMVQDDVVNALESAYTTAALMIAEMGCIETLQEFLVFIFHLQETATRDDLTVRHKCNLHRIAIALTALLSRSVGVYGEYCEQLIDRRRRDAPYLLPPLTEDASPSLHAMNLEITEDLLLDRQAIVACLQSAGIRSERLQTETLFMNDRRVSLIDGVTPRDGNMSDNYPDIDSVKSSPDVARVSREKLNENFLIIFEFPQKTLMNIQELNLLELNFEGMKRVLTAPNDQTKLDEVKKEKQEQMAKELKEQDFEELMKHTEPSVSYDNLKFLV